MCQGPVVVEAPARAAAARDAGTQAIFDQGTEVGLLAQQRFPGGVDCSPEHHYDYGRRWRPPMPPWRRLCR